MLIFYAIFCVIYQICCGERPLSICASANHPFKTKDNTCASFKDICVKKNDPECDNFHNICAQCLPSNYSALIFDDIQRVKDEMKIITNKLEKCGNETTSIINSRYQILLDKTVRSETGHIASLGTMNAMLIVCIVLIIIQFVVMLVEIRFKLKTKFIEMNKEIKYKPLRSRKYEKVCTMILKLEQKINEFGTISEPEIDRISNIFLEKFKAANLDNQTSIIKFRQSNLSQHIELSVYNNNNIVQIKKQICSQISIGSSYYYKIMRLKYNGNILDDNRYLLPYVTDRNIDVFYEIDYSIDSDQIVIIKLEGNINAPELLQIRKSDKVADLKRIVSMFTNTRDCFCAKTSQNTKSEILTEASTITECHLNDGDSVRFIKRISGRLIIKSIFEEKDSLVIEYSNSDLISSISFKAAHKFSSDPKDFHLFLNNQYLESDKFIFEYNIDERSNIKFICIMKLKGKLEINYDDCIDEGFYSTLYTGKETLGGPDILIKRYNIPKIGKDEKDLISSGLIKYSIIKSNPIFVKSKGIYSDNEFFYVSMEYLSGRTLTNLLEKSNIEEAKIIRWSKQILEGIKYFNENGFIFQDLKSFQFLIDEKENLKFHSFTTEFRNIQQTYQSSDHTTMCLSPEIRNGKNFDKQTDVWSLGVLLVDMVNSIEKKSTQPNIIEIDQIDQLVKDNKLHEKWPNWMKAEMRHFIESCLRYYPNERSTVNELLQHSFLKIDHSN